MSNSQWVYLILAAVTFVGGAIAIKIDRNDIKRSYVWAMCILQLIMIINRAS